MKFLKTYELFGFGSKKPKTWKDRFNDIYNFYIKNKNKKISAMDIPHADVKKDEVSISQGFDNHLVFYAQTGLNHNWEVLDFSEVDYADKKSTKGVYKITPEIYEEYKKKIQEISDWLDERSDKSSGMSDSTISDSGLDLDFDEGDLALEEINDKIKSELKSVGKEYEFEISFHSWTSNSSNVHVVERRKLKITDIKFGFGGGRFWCELFTKGAFDEPTYLWIESDSSSEYYDLEENKWPYSRNKVISMNIVEKEMTRKQKRDYDNNRKFPYAISYMVTPCEYKSIELIKDISQILVEMNLGLKK
jgi:hypothetical protein